MTQSLQLLEEKLRELTGHTCSEIIAGEGVGTAISLGFGPVVRHKTVKTKRGSHQMLVYHASIFIQDATWRLENSSSVICSTAADDNSPVVP